MYLNTLSKKPLHEAIALAQASISANCEGDKTQPHSPGVSRGYEVVCHLLDPLVHLLPYGAGYQLYSNRERVRINVPLINNADIEASACKGIGAHESRRTSANNEEINVGLLHA